ncbi:TPA: hypothetical protein N0F65_000881 [Lagenidium giganteum]|uniref:Uncharacterized protein n=1 Tax=Lagenidium giganteum TaxID=4803 RepID=A0AAV2Z2B1_9STRA|nr:TPA: hypothetical protein N0F65_000881 [Lagenidium giganteum]
MSSACIPRRFNALNAAHGNVKITTGKAPLPFDLYEFLATELLADKSRSSVFARTFMILCWNLMCRSHVKRPV